MRNLSGFCVVKMKFQRSLRINISTGMFNNVKMYFLYKSHCLICLTHIKSSHMSCNDNLIILLRICLLYSIHCYDDSVSNKNIINHKYISTVFILM